ncbi:hypothetical protein EMCRGX_G031658 [Ephydatia muelleri]
MYRCKICLSPVLLRKKRKRLDVLSSSLVRQGIAELACKQGKSSDEVKEFSEGYACISCFRAVSRYVMLKEVESQLVNKLSASRPVEMDGSIQAKCCMAGTKRSHASAGSVERTMKVVVTNHGYEKRYTLSPSKQGLGLSLGRKSWKAFATNAFQTAGVLRQHLFKRMLIELRVEFLRLSSDSTLLTTDCENLKQFDWDKLYATIQSKAPLLHGVLETCIPQHSRMKKCVVYCRLQKLGICLSSVATWSLIDKLGRNHDEIVKSWSHALEKTIPTDHGCATVIQQTNTQCSSDTSQTSHNSSMLSVFGSPMALPVITAHSCDESSIYQSPSSRDDSPFGAILGNKPPGDAGAGAGECLGAQIMCNITATSIYAPVDHNTNGNMFVTESVLSPHLSDNEVSSEGTMSIPPPSDRDDTAPTDLEEWCGFRLVGDNIDKTIGPRDMRLNNQSKSLHYFHVYAVKDRVDVRHLSPSVTMLSPGDMDVTKFLPSDEDNETLLANYKVLMARVITKHVPGLAHLSPLIPNIRHAHSDSMSKKSEVVPLGVLLKNENKLDEMVEIMDELQKYIPSKTTVQVFDDGNGDVERMEIHHLSPIVLGGDQLTTARAIGSQRMRKNSHETTRRLVGFIPVTEDWHTKVCFMKASDDVVWTCLYKTTSGLDVGTLNQLRNVINRRNVSKDPSSNVNASEDFLEAVTSAHIVAAAMEVLGVTKLAELQDSVKQCSTHGDQLSAIQAITNTICSEFVKVGIHEPPARRKELNDHIQQYAMETISMGLLFSEFKDAIKEGDGERVLRCWKYFMLLFRGSRHSNYCIEALRLLALYYYILPPRYAAQMLWGRFINTHGQEGCNVSADIHMEHLNRLCKESISHLGANKTPHAIERVAPDLNSHGIVE